ncbi:hypothetical protein MTO96_028021 [Rhipicephalus appendiculatus]
MECCHDNARRRQDCSGSRSPATVAVAANAAGPLARPSGRNTLPGLPAGGGEPAWPRATRARRAAVGGPAAFKEAISRRLSRGSVHDASDYCLTAKLIEELNVGVALFRDVLLSVSSAQDGPELRQRIRTLRQRCVQACVDAAHLLLPHIRSAVSDGIPVDSQQLVNLVCCTQMLLRELTKCRALLVAHKMDMRDFSEPVGPPGGVAVLDKLVLWRPPPKDYHLEELRSIDRDAETVRSVLAEMQEFMPHESNCKNLIEEGLFKWRRKGGLYGQLGHHLCCLCRSHIS